MAKFQEHDVAMLTHAIGLPHYYFHEGMEGTIVYVWGKGELFEVEFEDDETGETVDVLTLRPEDLEKVVY